MFFFCIPKASTPREDVGFVSSRIVIGFWWMANIILLTALTGNMKASLMVRTDADKVESIADVAEKPHLKPILWKGTAYESLFKV